MLFTSDPHKAHYNTTFQTLALLTNSLASWKEREREYHRNIKQLETVSGECILILSLAQKMDRL